MRIDAIEIKDFLGVSRFSAALKKPITLISGHNGSGKSSIQEAVRMALTGEPSRVALKKDFSRLVREGEKRASVVLGGVDQGQDWVANIDLPSGKGQHLDDPILPYVLDAQRFARLDANARRKFLFGLMNIQTDYEAIKARLAEKEIEQGQIDAIAPLLRAGFEAAHDEAANRARDAKAGWRIITGETYGEKKAATWGAEKPESSTASIGELEAKLEKLDRSIAEINQSIGAIREVRNRNTQAVERLASLREKAGRYTRFASKLERDESELKEWEQNVEETRRAAQGGRKAGLVHDLAYCLQWSLTVLPFGEMSGRQRESFDQANAALDAYKAEHGALAEESSAPDRDAIARLPEYEKALRLMQSAVANDRRDLAEANAIAEAIKKAKADISEAPPAEELKSQETLLAERQGERKSLVSELTGERLLQRKAAEADANTAKALLEHESVLAWTKIADALAPNGIPGEMLAEALDPINARLEYTSQKTAWDRISIEPNMDISAGWPDSPLRAYALLSESEKWRADAMIAEAISFVSNTALLVLDRFDVLDLDGRADLIFWLDTLAREGVIETALIFGTLKAIPANLPETVAAYWLGNETT
jgi:energy-coupling factor transporter ATP-binding protein EcfA2